MLQFHWPFPFVLSLASKFPIVRHCPNSHSKMAENEEGMPSVKGMLGEWVLAPGESNSDLRRFHFWVSRSWSLKWFNAASPKLLPFCCDREQALSEETLVPQTVDKYIVSRTHVYTHTACWIHRMVSLRHDLILFSLKILSVWVFRAALDNENVQHETAAQTLLSLVMLKRK